MVRFLALAFAFALIHTGGLVAQGGPPPRSATLFRVVNEVIVPAFAPDSVRTTAAWTNPNDGKGPLDSLKVNITRLGGGWISSVYTGANLPTSLSVTQELPQVEATYDLTGQVCTYRGKSANAVNCVAVAAAPFAYVLLPPPPVTGLTVTNVKVP